VLGSAKISPWRVVRAQHGTYVDARTGRHHWPDYAVFYGVPILIVAICLWRHVELSVAAATALLTASGLVGVLLFGVMVQVADRAMTWVDENPPKGKQTSDHAKFLGELAANAGYASLICIVSAVVYVVAVTSAPETGKEAGALLGAASAIGLGLGVHLVLTLLMVMKRVFALTEQRLTQARTGPDQNVVRHERKARSSSGR
jgi:hypothetical protein